jgi:hypothetical protein
MPNDALLAPRKTILVAATIFASFSPCVTVGTDSHQWLHRTGISTGAPALADSRIGSGYFNLSGMRLDLHHASRRRSRL